MSGSALSTAVSAYRETFHDSPPVATLPADKLAKATTLIIEAVRSGEKFKSDAAFFEALGMAAPPDDVEL